MIAVGRGTLRRIAHGARPGEDGWAEEPNRLLVLCEADVWCRESPRGIPPKSKGNLGWKVSPLLNGSAQCLCFSHLNTLNNLEGRNGGAGAF